MKEVNDNKLIKLYLCSGKELLEDQLNSFYCVWYNNQLTSYTRSRFMETTPDPQFTQIILNCIYLPNCCDNFHHWINDHVIHSSKRCQLMMATRNLVSTICYRKITKHQGPVQNINYYSAWTLTIIGQTKIKLKNLPSHCLSNTKIKKFNSTKQSHLNAIKHSILVEGYFTFISVSMHKQNKLFNMLL